MSKIIIIGTPLTGKTTLANELRKVTSIPVLDFDEELVKLNDGKYPANYPILNEQLKNQVINVVSTMNDVVFFAFEIDLNSLHDMKHKGFMVIQLTAPVDVLTQRNEERLKHDPDNDAFQYIPKNLEYQNTLRNEGLVDKTIDTSSEAPNVTLHSIITYIQNAR